MTTFHIIGCTAKAGQTPAAFGQQKNASKPPSFSTAADTVSPSTPTEVPVKILKEEKGINNGKEIS